MEDRRKRIDLTAGALTIAAVAIALYVAVQASAGAAAYVVLALPIPVVGAAVLVPTRHPRGARVAATAVLATIGVIGILTIGILFIPATLAMAISAGWHARSANGGVAG